jgi:hypothetical protein
LGGAYSLTATDWAVAWTVAARNRLRSRDFMQGTIAGVEVAARESACCMLGSAAAICNMAEFADVLSRTQGDLLP